MMMELEHEVEDREGRENKLREECVSKTERLCALQEKIIVSCKYCFDNLIGPKSRTVNKCTL